MGTTIPHFSMRPILWMTNAALFLTCIILFTSVSSSAQSYSSLSNTIDTITASTDVYYLGPDQHVHELLWHTQSPWNAADLTASANAPVAVQGSSLASHVDTITNSVEVYYIGSDQHIHELWWNTSSPWQTADVTASANAPNATLGSSLASHADTITNSVKVYYIGSDQHIHELLWNASSSWQTTDITASANAPNAELGTALTSHLNTITNSSEVYYVGSDWHIHELWWNTSSPWQTADVTASTGSLEASGSALTSVINRSASSVELFYIASDRHVHEFRWTPSNGWQTTDITASAGGADTTAGTSLTTHVDTDVNSLEVYYLGWDQHVHELWQTPTSGWQTTDIAFNAGAPNGAGGGALARQFRYDY
jgi:hypothetical protein